mmetsp:Transcript_17264/g.37069  ORF Transcript_17264/g.37069 Transcript_17264/m.37069 type:complete len:418 (+) Transcript_17264:1452-2705(+)
MAVPAAWRLVRHGDHLLDALCLSRLRRRRRRRQQGRAQLWARALVDRRGRPHGDDGGQVWRVGGQAPRVGARARLVDDPARRQPGRRDGGAAGRRPRLAPRRSHCRRLRRVALRRARLLLLFVWLLHVARPLLHHATQGAYHAQLGREHPHADVCVGRGARRRRPCRPGPLRRAREERRRRACSLRRPVPPHVQPVPLPRHRDAARLVMVGHAVHCLSRPRALQHVLLELRLSPRRHRRRVRRLLRHDGLPRRPRLCDCRPRGRLGRRLCRLHAHAHTPRAQARHLHAHAQVWPARTLQLAPRGDSRRHPQADRHAHLHGRGQRRFRRALRPRVSRLAGRARGALEPRGRVHLQALRRVFRRTHAQVQRRPLARPRAPSQDGRPGEPPPLPLIIVRGQGGRRRRFAARRAALHRALA